MSEEPGVRVHKLSGVGLKLPDGKPATALGVCIRGADSYLTGLTSDGSHFLEPVTEEVAEIIFIGGGKSKHSRSPEAQ